MSRVQASPLKRYFPKQAAVFAARVHWGYAGQIARLDSFLGSMPTYPSIDAALDDLTDDKEFEVLVSALLVEAYPELVPMGGTGDAGRDAVLRDGLFGGEQTRFQYSIENRWTEKVRRELRRYAGPTDVRHLVFVSSRPTGQASIDLIVAEAAAGAITLQIFGRQWLRPRLESRWDLAERFLHVAPRVPPLLASPTEYASSRSKLIPGFEAPLVGTERQRAVIASFCDDAGARALLIVGPGGTGKTRLALDAIPPSIPGFVLGGSTAVCREIAQELPPHRPAVLLIDDAHSQARLSELQAMLRHARWSGVKLILTVRPGYVEKVKRALGLPDSETAQVDLGELPRAQIDALLRNAPHAIEDEGIRVRLVKLAQGNPLIAHMAGHAVRTTGIDAETSAAFLREYCRIERFEERQRVVLGLLALAGTLSPLRDRALITAAMPGESSASVFEILKHMADEGLIQGSREAFSIKPDILAPVLIADILLPENSPPPLDVREAVARSDGRTRTELVERLAAAAMFAHGRGSDVLRDLVRSAWPGEGTSRRAWREALDLVKAYGFALPSDARELIGKYVGAANGLAGEDPAELSALASSAAGAARSLAPDDVHAAVDLLLDIFAIGPDLGNGEETNPALRVFRELSKHALPYEHLSVGGRQLSILAAVQQWHASAMTEKDVEPSRAWRGIALAGTQLLRCHFEYSAESPDSRSRIIFGQFEAPLSVELHAAVEGGARLVAGAVPYLDGDAHSALLDRLGRVEGIVRNGILPNSGSATEGARDLLRRAMDMVMAAFVAAWHGLAPAVRHRLVWFAKGRPSLARCARRDLELRRLSVIYPIFEHWRNHDRWQRTVQGRARQLALQFPGMSGVRFLEEALALGEHLRNPSGGWFFVDALAETLTSEDTEEVARYFVGSPRLRNFAAQLVAAALRRFSPHLDSVLERVAALPGGDAVAARVLDSLQPDAERRALALLIRRTSPPLIEVAEHVEMCARLTPLRKLSLLTYLIERLGSDHLARGLTVLGTTAKSIKVKPPPAMQRRITLQVVRFLSITEVDSNGFVWFEPLFETIASWGTDSIVEIIEARVERILSLDDRPHRDLHRLGDEVRRVVGLLAPQQKENVVQLLLGWLQGAVDHPLRPEDAVYDLLRAAMTPDEFRLLAIRWAGDAPTRRLAIGAISGRCPSLEFDQVGRALLRQTLTHDEEESLLWASDLRRWSGPASLKYRERVAFFEPWTRDEAAAIRRFGARAHRYFDEQATRAERQEFIEENA